MLETYEQNSKKKLITTILSVVVIAGVIVFADALKSGKLSAEIAEHTGSRTGIASTSQVTVTPSSSPTASPAASTTASTTSGARDGSYSAKTAYYVPSGTEAIQVSVTLSGGVIQDVSIQNSEGNRDSAAFQQDFASTYKSYVVGKKISGLQLNTVAGASDTTQGFNDALSQISSKAQA